VTLLNTTSAYKIAIPATSINFEERVIIDPALPKRNVMNNEASGLTSRTRLPANMAGQPIQC